MLASLLRIILLTATLKILERGLDKGPIIIVINSEKEFSNDAKEKAGKANIILLNGYQFANLLVRYDVELGL